ncbi:3-dehydroquinate synthase II [Cellulosilyticum ruminicola]|uniref:3-dehydroquinate synthase II n=1 Tax=Cellulosilyticum ruminicola TaxID=425254 RepID=UPI0006CF26FE|nr:3-dehydroquinate synthase II [Cellulosilyticum ruminicola]
MEQVANIINNLPIQSVLISKKAFDTDKTKISKRINYMVYMDKDEQLDKLDKDITIVSAYQEQLEQIKSKGYKTGYYVKVVDRETLDLAWQEGIKHDVLIIEFKDPTNIPLELVIAQIENNKANVALFKVVNSVEDAKIASQVLERGTDGVVITDLSSDNLQKINVLTDETQKINLQEVIVDKIEYIGMGDRTCIDTTSLMGVDEGMIIGSTSAGGIMVCSETHYLPYMELRPFRVNAGAVHSYVMAPDNTSRYLSELEVGKTLMCVSTNGTARKVSVGRSKTEKRPLLLIKGRIGETPINVVLQDDWHVRVMGVDGKPKNITELKKGDKLFGCLMEPGRHVGLNVSETIMEK